jgi:hypothetical protein
LKRLDSAKEIEEFYLDFLPQRLGFPSEILGFPSGEIWISFIALAPAFYAVLAHRRLRGAPLA